jgi:hypothetical protein
MLRLELEAQVANLQAEADAMVAEAAVESGKPIEIAPAVPVDAADDQPAASEDDSAG